MRSFVDVFAGYDASSRRPGRAPGRCATSTPLVAAALAATRRWSTAAARTSPRRLRADRVPRRRPRGRGRRRLLPAPGDLPPDLPLAADARRRRPADPAAAGGARARAGRRCPRAERVLRLRRHLRGEEPRHLRGHGRRQGARTCVDTGAEVLVAGDNSCLMHVGGMLSRQRAGRPRHAPRRDARRDREHATSRRACPHEPRTVRRHAGRSPRAAADGARPDSQLRQQPRARHAHDPRQARRPSSPRSTTGRSCARPARRSRTTRCATWTSYLLQLEEALTARGGHVHWARDADEAYAIVAAHRQGHGVDEVVKVKSMATQEIGLNEALAAQGITAWETDLAELIVQLGDDLPSHILVPAIHRNRSEIREIFRARDGRGRASRPRGPDRRARRRSPRRPGCTCARSSCAPRSRISGANFAVAETGTLVVVESEGNGRMCLTLPEMLISVVGIEKLRAHLAGPRRLPAAAAALSTGERMNPYTSMWTGVTPGDGPRSCTSCCSTTAAPTSLADEVGRQALRCIRCSACLNVCPVYERAGGHAYGSVYPGPIGAILNPAAQGRRRRRADRLAALRLHASAAPASRCARCAIDIPEVLVHLRAKVVDAHRAGRQRRGVAMRAAAWVLGDARRTRWPSAPQRLAGRLVSAVGRRTLPGGRTAIGRLPWPGAVDRRPRPALAAPGVVPRLVEAHGRRPPRRRGTTGERPRRGPRPGPPRRSADAGAAAQESPLPGRVPASSTAARRARGPVRRAGGGLPRRRCVRCTDGRGRGGRSRPALSGGGARASCRTACRPSGSAPASRPASSGSRTRADGAAELDRRRRRRLTGCAVGIAETGTIVLDPAPARAAGR